MSKADFSETGVVTETSAGVDPQVLVSELIRTFPRDRRFSAREIALQYPVLGNDRACLIDLAWEEFCRLRESGTDIRPAEFARQYQEIEQSLYRVMEFDQLLHDHPSYIEGIPEDRWPVPGDTFCGYQLLEQLGRGAFSRVFVAREPSLGSRRVVTKICLRGENEACLLGQLGHPAIAMAHSIHTEPGSGLSVICMPYETRVTLHQVSEILHRSPRTARTSVAQIQVIVGRINAEDPGLAVHSGVAHRNSGAGTVTELTVGWGISLAEALDAAHQKKILHCDVKPGNVLLLNDLTVKLLDFNLASEDGASQTPIGGTLPFMASEQLQQVAAPDGKLRDVAGRTVETDVFGLCATLWYFLCGAPPFGVHLESESRQASAENLLERQRRGISDADTARAAELVARPVVDVLRRGLQFDPDARPRTALQLAFELREALASVSAAADSASAARSVRAGSHSRLRRVVLQAGIATAVTVTGVALMMTFGGRAELQRVMHEAGELTEAGQSAQAQDVLAGFLERHPANELAAARLAWLQIADGRHADAQRILSPFIGVGACAEVRFAELCLRSADLTPPSSMLSEDPVQGNDGSRPNEGSPEQRMWLEIVAQWKNMATIPQLAQAARVNAAIMLFEGGRVNECEDLLNEQPANSVSYPVEHRLRTCVRLMQDFRNRVPADPELVSALRRFRHDTLSRFETWTLMTLLARHLSSADASSFGRIPGLTIENGAAELLSVIDSAARMKISSADLKSLMCWSLDQAPPFVADKFSRVIQNGAEFPQNALAELMVAPRDTWEVASSH